MMQDHVLAPVGPQAQATAALFRAMFWTATVVFLLVTIALVEGLRRGTRAAGRAAQPAPDERRLRQVVGGAVIVTALILVTMIVLSVRTNERVHASSSGEPLRLRLTGHQWWWQVDYLDSVPARQAGGVNEIHVPAGRDVEIDLRSADVIHSFWAPRVTGKRDLVPGDTHTLHFKADTAGTYLGLCSEFCGHQHSQMRMHVVAHPPEEWSTWYEQALSVPAAAIDSTQPGRALFLRSSCVLCHTVRGTIAGSRVGPDLTHVGSRLDLASGALPNTTEALTRWLRDPSAIKPGVRMPPSTLSDDDLATLVAWLRELR